MSRRRKFKDPLERVIRPIVEGQIAAAFDGHPNLAKEVTWFKPRLDKRQTFINSMSKRVVNDLLSPEVRGRLILALRDLDKTQAEGNGD